LLELASAMKNLNPTTMRTYQVEGRGVDKSGQSVLEPLLKSDSMKAVLAVFQGKARLVDAPEQLFEVATTTVAPATTAAPGGTSKPGATTTTSSLVPVYVDENTYGVLPPDDPACR
jgi:hypothetical protein